MLPGTVEQSFCPTTAFLTGLSRGKTLMGDRKNGGYFNNRLATPGGIFPRGAFSRDPRIGFYCHAQD
ncbi:hypothetical protein ABH999_002691 [Bradyrhizobium yuanmingense]